jgi:6-phosphogluconolactonase/glucosamine-6-phosphate isomerase/deaminase
MNMDGRMSTVIPADGSGVAKVVKVGRQSAKSGVRVFAAVAMLDSVNQGFSQSEQQPGEPQGSHAGGADSSVGGAGYEVVSAPTAPRMPGFTILRESADDAIDALCADLYLHALNCTRTFGDFHCAVSGEPAVEPILRRLMLDPSLREFPWHRTHLWQVEELVVPRDSADSRWTVLRDMLIEPSDIPRPQVHAMHIERSDVVLRYERDLRETLGWREKGHDRLDYCLLGPSSLEIPDDPGQDTLVTEDESVSPVRVTLARRTIAAARLVACLLTGSEARAKVQRLSRERREWPMKTTGGETRWYVDHDAAAHP